MFEAAVSTKPIRRQRTIIFFFDSVHSLGGRHLSHFAFFPITNELMNLPW